MSHHQPTPAVDHEGEARDAEATIPEAPAQHFGAVESEPTPVTPPQAGDGDAVDPRDELTGG